VIVRISHSGEGWKETRHFLNLWLVMTTMEKNSLAYSQMILLVALVSICAFLSFKSHHMHCWIPVMCHRAQTLSAAPHLSRSRNPLIERVVITERGPFWLTWLESATIPAGWGHMYASKEEIRIVPVAKDYIILSTISTLDPFRAVNNRWTIPSLIAI
jgi:hypothetical protein